MPVFTQGFNANQVQPFSPGRSYMEGKANKQRYDFNQEQQRGMKQQNDLGDMKVQESRRIEQGMNARRAIDPKDPDAQAKLAQWEQQFPQLAKQERVGKMEEATKKIGLGINQLTMQSELLKNVYNQSQLDGVNEKFKEMGMKPVTMSDVFSMRGNANEGVNLLKNIRGTVSALSQDPDNKDLQAAAQNAQAEMAVYSKGMELNAKKEERAAALIDSQIGKNNRSPAAGGVNGGRGTGAERRSQRLVDYAQYLDDFDHLKPEHLRAAALDMNAAYPTSISERNRGNGTVDVISTRQAVPETYQKLLKYIESGGDSSTIVGRETIAAPDETTKQREERQAITRDLSLVAPVVDALIEILEAAPGVAGGRGFGSKLYGSLKDQFNEGSDPSDPDVQMAVLRTVFESKVTQLETVAKKLVDKGVFSKDDWKKVAQLAAGKGIFDSPETTKAALEELKVFTKLITDSYNKDSTVKKITNDAEYDALPSGTKFVGPDGVPRNKP